MSPLLTYQDIARLTGQSISTVKKTVYSGSFDEVYARVQVQVGGE